MGRSCAHRAQHINQPLCFRLAYKGTFMFLQNPRNELPDHFLGFANPTRLRILERLAKLGEVNVNDLALHLHMSQPRISWHLRMLRLGGVIRTRREGRQVYCSLDVENIRRYRERLDQMLGMAQKMKVGEEVGA
ncbi:MAG: helix-turn-helix transcriptional regulator [Chloroflexi bacterium]|nr:MAG: helix-turn-helix transcriptional regulator [Chloroflexota bacterium]TMG20937.1 MAG: helix-turn-helix transcriptional regulator [Chloroflexota bacterium]TMG67603.1 MAG: helix-turn-helix transcriptional regulator [Chloroflexota bacterium]